MYNIEEGPPDKAKINKKDALNYLRKMMLIRRMETTASNFYKTKEVRGFLHLCIGQEAVCVGLHAAMRPDDHLITAYRCHGYCYLMGISVTGVLAELLGREKGCARGKGGSMHMYAPKFYGGNGIVGAQVPLGAGVALAEKIRGGKGVCFALYGDGAANQGQIFEAFNIAELLKLPVIFVCENNQYAMGTSVGRHAMNSEFYTRGDVIPGIWVEGMDILACKNASAFAIDHALNKGPILIEFFTYRYQGHSMSDPGTSYRDRKEVEEVRKTRDPIQTFRNTLYDLKFLTEEENKNLEKEVKKEVDDASKEGLASNEIPFKELHSDIYLKNFEPKIRGTLSYIYQHENIGKPFIPWK